MKGEGEMTMKALVIFTAVCFSTSAYAQDAPPKAGNKPLLQVRPKEPTGCKLVGRVKGTKLMPRRPTAATPSTQLIRQSPTFRMPFRATRDAYQTATGTMTARQSSAA
jgi:hypothetical protein